MNYFLKWKMSSFTHLNITQFLGALNDNIFRFLLIYYCIDLQGAENSEVILAIAGIVFVIPFLIFSSFSGIIADRFSKSRVIIFCKVLELVVMALGVVAFAFKTIIAAYIILFLMATQSTIFGPSKYGIIPELVRKNKISSANGYLNLFTHTAIIAGTFLASFLTDITNRNFILSAIGCCFVSFLGILSSVKIKKTKPSGEKKKLHPWFIVETYRTLYRIRNETVLLSMFFASSYFMFMGGFIQMNIIPYAMHCLDLTDVQGGYLFLLVAIGIGAGSVLAGKLSGKKVELGLIPLSGLAIAIGFFFLDFYSNRLEYVIPLALLLGLFSGIFVVPINSYIQIVSPKEYRGQILAASYFFTFIGLLLSSAFLYFINQVAGFAPNKSFTILGAVTLLVIVFMTYMLYDYLYRFVGMLFSKCRFKVTVEGRENIPYNKPAIYLCQQKEWNDVLLFMGTQRERIQFFSEKNFEDESWMKKLYNIFRIIQIPSIDSLKNNEYRCKQIEKSLNKGLSICILTEEDPSNPNEMKKVQCFFEKHSSIVSHPIIVVSITKKEKPDSDSASVSSSNLGLDLDAKSNLFDKVVSRYREPAAITFSNPINPII